MRRSKGQAAFALCALAACSLLSCKSRPTVSPGTTVRLNYTLRVDGKVLDSTEGKEPLVYIQGDGQFLRGFESGMEGLRAGDKREFKVPPKDGYGELDKSAVINVPLAAFPATKGLKPGDIVQGMQGKRPVRARIVRVGPNDITLDFNHPLAGKTLEFSVQVIEVSRPS